MKLLDVVFSLALAAVVAAIALPEIARVRAAQRRYKCYTKLMKIGFGIQQYSDTFDYLPPALTGTEGLSVETGNQRRLSGFVGILPFIDQQPAWQTIRDGYDSFPSMGPSPSYPPQMFKPWSVQIDDFICPSDEAVQSDYGLRSYVFCYGDGVQSVGYNFDNSTSNITESAKQHQDAVGRGAFVPGKLIRREDITDGISSTIMVSETQIGLNPGLPPSSVAIGSMNLIDGIDDADAVLNPYARKEFDAKTKLWPMGRGSRWPEGHFLLNAFTTNIPPSSISVTQNEDAHTGVLSATSYHNDGGVMLLFVDGAVKFIARTVDTGDQSNKTVCPQNGNVGAESPFGVWGALGTRASEESVPPVTRMPYKKVHPFKS